MTRLIDVIASALALMIFSPVLLISSFFIILEDGWPIIFKQERVGIGAKFFVLYKLRSMRNRKEVGMTITVGDRDPRVLRVGGVIRKYKIDEIPQFWNVIIGDMSIVGPRPEVKRYTDLYDEKQMEVLNVRPGITDFASVYFRNENKILECQSDPEKYYIEYLMPAKIELNQRYIDNPSLKSYFLVLWLTIKAIFSFNKSNIIK